MEWIIMSVIGVFIIKYLLIFVSYLMVYAYHLFKNHKVDVVHKIDENIGKNNPNKYKSKISNLISGCILRQIVYTGWIPSHILRNFIYSYIYKMKLGKNITIYGRSEFRAPHKLKIGDGTIIGDQAILDARNGIEIGENVNLSTGVWIWTEQHDYNCPYFYCHAKGGKVIIGDRAWISCRAIILPGVSIGEGAVIAAGSVVTNDVQPFSVYGGVPAKKIGDRNTNLKYIFNSEDKIDFF